MKVFEKIASLVQARINCGPENSRDWTAQRAGWFDRHTADVLNIVTANLPSGSGFDAGVRLDLDNSSGDRLVFTTSYHHMNEAGYYDGWTDHKIIVTPSLVLRFHLRVTGRDKRQIKEYIAETFAHALNFDLPE